MESMGFWCGPQNRWRSQLARLLPACGQRVRLSGMASTSQAGRGASNWSSFACALHGSDLTACACC